MRYQPEDIGCKYHIYATFKRQIQSHQVRSINFFCRKSLELAKNSFENWKKNHFSLKFFIEIKLEIFFPKKCLDTQYGHIEFKWNIFQSFKLYVASKILSHATSYMTQLNSRTFKQFKTNRITLQTYHHANINIHHNYYLIFKKTYLH